MDQPREIRSAEPSRRSVLRNLALTAGGAAVLAATAGGTRQAEAQTKMAPQSVGYQSTPKGAERCDNCLQFTAPASCKVVSGAIAPAGWCKIYAKRSA
ncbi:MAG TPA: hypothetical protein VKQ73_09005 [Stellaceae bacterium]|nr:hypothetical protein [Stellaceae bacterium]